MKLTFAAAILFAAALPVGAERPAAAQPDQLSWLSTGDSYSSGEGVLGNIGDCAQSGDAWGPRVASLLQQHGVGIGQLQMSACSGHLVEDFYNPRPHTDEDPAGNDPASLWDWSLRQPGAPDGDRYDVITMSFGGNDIGFDDVIKDCLAAPFHRLNSDEVPPPVGRGGIISREVSDLYWPLYDIVPFTGDDCSVDRTALLRRVDALFNPTNDCRPDNPGDIDNFGWRGPRSLYPNYDCELVIDAANSVTGSMTDFWVHVANESLTDDGILVLTGYPILFAPSSQWGIRELRRCHGVTRASADMLGDVAAELDAAYRNGADAANERLGWERVVYVSLLDLYDERSHQLCGTGPTWINGMLTLTRDRPHLVTVPYTGSRFEIPVRVELRPVRFRYLGAFHPNAAGHDATAHLVAQHVLHALPTRIGHEGLHDAAVPALCGHRPGHLVNGSLAPEFLGDGSSEFGGLPTGDVWLRADLGSVAGDFSGRGVTETVAVVGCSAGGSGSDDTVVAWGPGRDVAWQLRPHDVDEQMTARPSQIQLLESDGASLVVEYGTFAAHDPDCCPSMTRRTVVDMSDGNPTVVTLAGDTAAEQTDEEAFVLRDDGLGPFDFGHAGTNDVLEALFAELGAVTSDELVTFLNRDVEAFGDRYVNDFDQGFRFPYGRVTCFANSLCVQFGGDVSPDVLVGWEQRRQPPSAVPTPDPLRTRHEVTVGSTWSDHLDVIDVRSGGCFSSGTGDSDGIFLGLTSSGEWFTRWDDDGHYVEASPDPDDVTVHILAAGDRIHELWGDC